MAELNARDAKLVQFLNEAHAKEAEVEADLTAHINLTQKAPYKKRLQQHLRETKDHKKRVSRRIKELGGNASIGVRALGVPLGVPDMAGELAGKAIAAVKGQVGVARAALTDQPETHLRNAREELREEYVEIGTYLAIEGFASEVGDRETAQLARSIRRDEQKTADYLERLIPQLMKDVVKAEIPRDQRPQDGRRRRAASTRPRATVSRSRTTARTSSTRSPARKASTRARRATKAAATGARSGARAAGTSAKRSAAGSRGGSSNGSRTSSNGRSRASSRSRKTAARA